MKRTASALLLIASLAILSGCAGSFREGVVQTSDTLPTAQSVGSIGQIYKGSLVVSSDFAADGSTRQLADYDFSKESAPCSAIDSKSIQHKGDHTAYVMKKGGREFIFICRSLSRAEPRSNRLFLAGSHEECLTRTDSYVRHPNEMLRKAGDMCKGMVRSSPTSKAEQDFAASFKI